MNKVFIHYVLLLPVLIGLGCSAPKKPMLIQDVNEIHEIVTNPIWLSHEHILVNFIGADNILHTITDHETIIEEIAPFLAELSEFSVDYFVDATPNYLGRDVLLLQKIANRTGIRIITNTGLYGARANKYIPEYAKESTPENLAETWIGEYQNGIDGTSIKPGFIKIGIDNAETLSDLHQKLVQAAALTHLKTGLTIASHTGKAAGLWPQLAILKNMGVSPQAFIWVHAQAEDHHENYLKAAKMGCWISLDGVGPEMEGTVEKILYAKTNGFLDRVLISHDAGWYDPQKEIQDIRPYTAIFKSLYPELKSRGFTDAEFNLLVSVNPSHAFSIAIRNYRIDKNANQK